MVIFNRRIRGCMASVYTLALATAALLLPPVMAEVQTVSTQAGPITVTTLASGLNHPWGMAFLPDGRLLVTERAEELRMLDRDHTLSQPLKGTPEVFHRGQGGLLDVALDPAFSTTRLVYLSFAEPGQGGASTAVGRGKLEEGNISDFEVIFRQQPKVKGPNHFGGRIVFSPESTSLQRAVITAGQWSAGENTMTAPIFQILPHTPSLPMQSSIGYRPYLPPAWFSTRGRCFPTGVAAR